ncbi:unnamed protein product [Porites evermanni]|uniref:J domain-containing protein n=1 Tax=Porites evermanni TaxID=104178 RepID=A0ABN8LXE2_9CNID|nr:unnamed protein product [Porites evermanni]
MGGKQKSLLVINDSKDVHLKLKLYVPGDVVCWIPHTSKVIKPKDKLFCTSKWGSKLELVARFTNKKQPSKVLLKPQQWVGKRYVRITESLDVIEDDLSNYPEEEREGLRKKNRDEELDRTDGKRNFYSILRLDMDKVRAMSKDEQDKEILRAFLREIQIWHPNHNEDGDTEIVLELILAYDTLKDREKRARYNNLADYDKGWLSGKRFKAVFWPECETMAQRLAWLKRMGLLALSAGLAVGGIVSVVLTAGFTSPLFLCTIAGGIHSLRECISKEAVVDGCDVGKWLMSTGVGYLLAFLPGGAAIGAALLESAALSVAELTGIRIAISAGCAIVSSLGTDAKKRFIDGEKITVKQALGHAACKCAAAVAATLAGGAVAKAMRHSTQTTSKAANFVQEVKYTGEKASPLPATNLQPAIETTSYSVKSSIITSNLEGATDEIGEQSPSEGEDIPDGSECTREAVDTRGLKKYKNLKTTSGIFTYISKGWWYNGSSKMVVSYLLYGQRFTREVRGNGKQIEIPCLAKKIDVHFEIFGLTWRTISRYDRFKRCWFVPYEPHVFHFATPVIRTFTIDGILGWEAVMKVTDEHHNETNELS